MLKLKTASFLLVFLTAAAPNISPENVSFDPEKLAAIDEVMRQRIAEERMIGGFGLAARRGKIAYFEAWGQRDREAGLPMKVDTIVRIFSMSKPIVSVAAMILVEEGKLSLDDPVSKYLPQLGGLDVLEDGKRVAVGRDMTIRHLLTHTSGLTYGFFADDPVDVLYRKAETHKTKDIAALVDVLAGLPLKHRPGERWNYGYSTDVLGRVIEVVSGRPLDRYLEQRIFKPLGMHATGFYVRRENLPRLAKIYTPDANDSLTHADAEALSAAGRRNRDFTRPATFLSGGGGLASTGEDYFRFAQMLLNGGAGIVTGETVALMLKNHQPQPEPKFGFGFGIDPVPGRSGNLYGWGGAAGTRFWLDPEREMVVIFATQLYPGGGKRKAALRGEFLKMVYESLKD